MNSLPEDEQNLNPSLSDDADSPEAADASSEQPRVPFNQRHSPLEDRVLELLSHKHYRPAKPRVLAKNLGLSKDHLPELKAAIKRLAKRGQVIYGEKHLVLPAQNPPPQKISIEEEQREFLPPREPSAPLESEDSPPKKKRKKDREESRSDDPNNIVGVFRRTMSGNGYVRPRSAAGKLGDRSNDILIPKNDTLDAANGDTVRIRLSRRRIAGRIAGEVLDIVERDTHQFVGTFEDRGGEYVVAIDGKVFNRPIPVGDPGAKSVKPGDKVVVEMIRFPTHFEPGEGVITEVLGRKGQPGVDTLSIIREFGLPDDFPEEVLQDARDRAAEFDESVGSRRDLTQDTIITIDPIDARDFDDAVSLTRNEVGNWLLGVHIADVSYFVRRDSVLDLEARERGTSVYLPDRVLPMLPEIISNHLASLQPNKVRYAKSAFIEFTPEGVPISAEWANVAIKSARRFTYEEVDEYLADREAWREKLTPQVHALLARMHELAMILRKRRLDRGAIELTLPEIKVDLNDQGQVAGAHLVVNTVSHQIIEEFMLAANEAVARILDQAGVHFLRRVHEAPDPRKLTQLTTFVREVGIDCNSLESRFEIKRVIAEVHGKPEEHAVNYAVLRSMQKAVYSPVVEGHYALHSEHYCHFTSPIRRYPDLTVHRMLDELGAGKRPKDNLNAMSLLGDHCSEREQRAAAAERELKKVKLLTYLSTKIGLRMEAVVTGVEQFGMFVQGVELPAEGLIHIDSLQDDHYRYDPDTHTLEGHRAGKRYRLGDILQVEVAHVDVDSRELDFKLLKRLQTSEPPPRRPRKEKGKFRPVEKAKKGGAKGKRKRR